MSEEFHPVWLTDLHHWDISKLSGNDNLLEQLLTCCCRQVFRGCSATKQQRQLINRAIFHQNRLPSDLMASHLVKGPEILMKVVMGTKPQHNQPAAAPLTSFKRSNPMRFYIILYYAGK